MRGAQNQAAESVKQREMHANRESEEEDEGWDKHEIKQIINVHRKSQ